MGVSVPESTVKRPSSDKTLRERIAEWREADEELFEQASDAAGVASSCADELTPIAEALEAVVREGHCNDTCSHQLDAQYACDCWKSKILRIVCQP